MTVTADRRPRSRDEVRAELPDVDALVASLPDPATVELPVVRLAPIPTRPMPMPPAPARHARPEATRRRARTAAIVVGAVAAGLVALAGLIAAGLVALALAMPATPESPTTVSSGAHTSTSTCWVEHNSDADGGDERICGDPAKMPAGSTPDEPMVSV